MKKERSLILGGDQEILPWILTPLSSFSVLKASKFKQQFQMNMWRTFDEWSWKPPPLWGYENDRNISRENYKWNTYRTMSGSCMSIIGALKLGYAYNKIGYKPMNCENNLLGNLLTENDAFLTSKWLTMGCLDMDTSSSMPMVLWKLQ